MEKIEEQKSSNCKQIYNHLALFLALDKKNYNKSN